MTSMHYAVVVTIHWPWPWPGFGDMLVALALALALVLYSVALLTSLECYIKTSIDLLVF